MLTAGVYLRSMAKKEVGFSELNDKLDRVIDAMLTKEDVRKIVQEELQEIQKVQRDILQSLDSLATTIAKLQIEYASIVMQLSRHERWFKQIADKTGLSLES